MVDFHDYEEDSFNKEKSQMLITDKFSGFTWDFYFTGNRTASAIIKHLSAFVNFLKVQFNLTIKVIESDNEIFSVKPEVKRWCINKGIAIEPSAPDTQARNGGTKCSGGVVKEKARAMRLDANLPWTLWPEVTRAAIYLHNRTPNYSNHWKSPHEVFFTTIAFRNGIVTSPRKPNLSNLRSYGCKAFAMTDDTKRGKMKLQKLDPKAWIGFLVGYKSSNIWRIWIPSMDKVISTRDVVFDESSVFNGKQEDIMDSLMHTTTEDTATWIRTVELPRSDTASQAAHPAEMDSFFEDETIDGNQADDSTQGPSNHQRRELGAAIYDQGRRISSSGAGNSAGDKRSSAGGDGTGTSYLPTPPQTPPPVVLLAQCMARRVVAGYAPQDITTRDVHEVDALVAPSK